MTLRTASAIVFNDSRHLYTFALLFINLIRNVMSQQSIHASGAPKPVGLYPHAKRVGNLLFLSGIGPRDPETNGIPGLTLSTAGNFVTFDFEQQCHSVFRNVRAVLEAAGARWEDLVDVTVFLTNMDRDFETYNRIYASYFADNQPCRTTLGITCLPTPIAIELKCIAYLP
jgi:2-aminomuconate deaminase